MSRTRCFIAMPFIPELNFFYLYLQRHLEETYSLQVERGDHSVTTGSILDKIKRQIRVADLLIADVSGSNANVFYELGLADAYGKKVILITSDSVKEVPTDIRHLELIQYDLRRHTEFLSELDKAIRSTLIDKYTTLYERAIAFLQEFNEASGRYHASTSRKQFQLNVMKWEGRGSIPGDDNRIAQAQFLLPKVLENPTDAATLREVWSWLEGLDKKP
jgi:hypothetical protein